MNAGEESPSLSCDLPIGRPGFAVHNELTITGWATSPKGVSGVAVQIGERQWNAAYGLDSPGRGPAGYELHIETAEWKTGHYHLTVAAFDVEGGRSAIDGEIEVMPFTPPDDDSASDADPVRDGRIAMALDDPADVTDGQLEVSGWAFARDGIEAVLVTVDGQVQHEAVRPLVRPELLRDYGRDVAAEAGFVSRLEIDPRELPRTVTVVAVGGDGRAVGMEREIAAPTRNGPGQGRRDDEPEVARIESAPPPRRRRDRTAGPYHPRDHAGLAFEIEHRLRYRLAAALVEPGQTVVDVGCGSGWGTALLAEAGAGRAVGIEVGDAASAEGQRFAGGPAVELRRGSPEAVGLPDASADLAVCLEAADCVEDPEAAVAELRRVLRPDGIAVVAAPLQPMLRPADGDRHLSAAKLERALRENFAHARMRHQQTALASIVSGTGEDAPLRFDRLDPDPADDGGYLIAIAGDGDLPELDAIALLGSPGSIRRLEDAARAWEDRALLAEADASVSRAETDIARTQQERAAWTIRQDRAQLDALRTERDAERARTRDARSRASALEEQLEAEATLRESRERSLSWRLTRPLRSAKRWWLRLKWSA